MTRAAAFQALPSYANSRPAMSILQSGRPLFCGTARPPMRVVRPQLDQPNSRAVDPKEPAAILLTEAERLLANGGDATLNARVCDFAFELA
jgi:hypothetical protein